MTSNQSIYDILALNLDRFYALFMRLVAAYEQSVELEQRQQRTQEETSNMGNGPRRRDFTKWDYPFKQGSGNTGDQDADWLPDYFRTGDTQKGKSVYSNFLNFRGGANAGHTVQPEREDPYVFGSFAPRSGARPVGKEPEDLLGRLFQQMGIQPDGDGGFDVTNLILGGVDGPPLTSEFGRGGVILDLRGAPEEVRQIFQRLFNSNKTNLPTPEEIIRCYEEKDWSDVQIQIPMTALAIVRDEVDGIPNSVRPMTREYTRHLVEEYQKGTRHCCMSPTCDIELMYLVLAAHEAAAAKATTPEAPAADVVD